MEEVRFQQISTVADNHGNIVIVGLDFDGKLWSKPLFYYGNHAPLWQPLSMKCEQKQ